MRHTHLLGALFIAILMSVMSGCATHFVVQVNAIADAAATPGGTRYVLRNGNPDGGEDGLFFREFSAYFIPLLAQKGYQRVESSDKADIVIYFRYAVSDGRTGVSTFSHPLYETIGGNTINVTETKTDSGGTTTTTHSTLHIPLQTIYVGTAVESQSYTVYTSNAALEAYKIEAGTTEEATQHKVLWKTLISSTGESNDLRTTMPAMAAAAAPYLGGNSGAAVTVTLKPDDPQIIAVKKAARE